MNGDLSLADVLQTFAEDIQTLIDETITSGNPIDGAQLRAAQEKIENAANDINAADLSTMFRNNPDFARIESLTKEIFAKANDITGDEKNVARIVGIAAGSVTIAAAAATGNIGGVIKAVSDVAKIVD